MSHAVTSPDSRPAVQASTTAPETVRSDRVGGVSVWWISCPRAPRLTIRTAAILTLILTAASVATAFVVQLRGESLWPWGPGEFSAWQTVLRYVWIVIVCVAYAVLLSVPAWIRLSLAIRGARRRLTESLRREDWPKAALHLHRLCLLHAGLWGRVPPMAVMLDGLLRRRLPATRRLYVYHRQVPPVVPTDPLSSFTPEVVPIGQPSIWTAIGLLPVAFVVYVIVDVHTRGAWHPLVVANVVLVSALFLAYLGYHVLAWLGRLRYLRLAPGVVEWVRFPVRPGPPRIERVDARAADAALDLTGLWPILTLTPRAGGRRRAWRLPRKRADVIEAVMRALLSEAAVPPLPTEQLLG